MCSIIASFDPDKLKELYRLNAYRGELSYSLASFELKNHSPRLGILFQDKGKMPAVLIEEQKHNTGQFFVAHSQAPTTQSKNIHPAVYGDCLLWHNGIVKQKSLPPETWDTNWMLEQITYYGWSTLSRIDGTFACIMYYAGDLFVFRNEISPMFYDRELNFSSTKFENSFSLPPNQVFKIDLENKGLYNEAYFQTFENPYYIPENV